MATEVTNKPVSVDPGDLSEVQQAAEAWAGFLRQRATSKRSGTYKGTTRTSHFDDEAAADRIDQANHRLREATYAG